ncbi:hypothetical protein [Pectinatus frisingensis]|uniref:hypothetical protein n=1 Tax=Pectinatus frisingensis TaxID=865 RepID=UPI003D807225
MQSHTGLRIDAIARELDRQRYYRKHYLPLQIHKPRVMTLDEVKQRFWADRKAREEAKENMKHDNE